jgi:hypothetical protein
MSEPLLSICLPTYDRPDLLEYTLSRLKSVGDLAFPAEVVVVDAAVNPGVRELVQSLQRSMDGLVYFEQRERTGPVGGFLNAIFHARGKYVIYMGDDDSLVLESVVAHVQRLEADDDLTAIFADWIAYDDAAEREMHRYFRITECCEFLPTDPLGLFNFVVGNGILPESAVYRRNALVRAATLGWKGSYLQMRWLFQLARQGKVRFDTRPFFREHRVLKKEFQRGETANAAYALGLIGEMMRLELESFLKWSLAVAGHDAVPDDQRLAARTMIDRFLHARTTLEVQRAAAARDWLLACDLQRRLNLWYGTGSLEKQKRDVEQLVLPAAVQSLVMTAKSLSTKIGVLTVGFQSDAVRGFCKEFFPEVPFLSDSGFGDVYDELLVLKRRHGDPLPALPQRQNPLIVLCFEDLLRQQAVNGLPVEHLIL